MPLYHLGPSRADVM